MRYTTVNVSGQHAPALEHAGHLYDLRPFIDAEPTQLLKRGHALWDDLHRAWTAIDKEGRAPLGADVQLAPPVPAPGKIVCIGLNYRKHAVESGMAIPEEPIVFSKYGNTIAAPNEPVRIGGLEKVDYEAELAFVMGEKAANVREGDALSTVLGYTNANDVSERALQMRSGQWLIGKTLDGFLPMGPSLVSAQEVGDPSNLRVRGWLNDELRQDSNTSDLIFSVQEIIAYVSRFMTLEPGDVVCTGTPEGVVLGMDPQTWVRPGDTYTVEIGDLGRLTTPFTD